MKIVVKVGTGVLTKSETGTLDEASVVHLVDALSRLIHSGHQVVLVSSGAVGAGVSSLGLSSYPQDLRTKQACAAVGQTRLMHLYQNLFSHFEIKVAQLLLTADDIKCREGNVCATLNRLFEQERIIPVVNENDTVAVEELKFGDNDILSVRVAELIGAQMLFLMTSVDGLYPFGESSSGLIPYVDDIESVMGFAVNEQGKFSMGGMAAKLKAVKRANSSGIPVWIMNGRYPDRIDSLLKGKGVGTFFKACD